VKVLTTPRRRAIRAAVIALLTIVTTSAVTAGSATPAMAAPASEDGFVRLAHLSPDTPNVDVYLDALSSTTMPEQIFHGVGYGTMSDYLTLPAGTYAVSMRPSGAKPTTPPVLTTNVTVVPGHAYTVAGVGKYADLGLRIIPDDLSNPLHGSAMVRIVQASINAPLLDVSIKDGAQIATGVQFATTTSYRSVRPGALTLEVGAPGGTQFPLKVTLKPGCVYSILVLDNKAALTAQLRTDAESRGAAPVGGVGTGGGGTAPRSLLTPTTYVAAGALLLAFGLLLRRRPAARWAARPSRSL
jgi:hypothetical protein